MKPHKWHKEIHAYADGADIEHRRQEAFGMTEWTLISDHEFTWTENDCHEYRIKPQPKIFNHVCDKNCSFYSPLKNKEPQYLYVYMNHQAEMQFFWNPITPLKTDLTYQGKIKLEDESC